MMHYMSDTGIHLFNANNQGRWRAMDLPTGGLPNDQDVFSRHAPGGGQVVARRPLSPARIAELFELPARAAGTWSRTRSASAGSWCPKA